MRVNLSFFGTLLTVAASQHASTCCQKDTIFQGVIKSGSNDFHVELKLYTRAVPSYNTCTEFYGGLGNCSIRKIQNEDENS